MVINRRLAIRQELVPDAFHALPSAFGLSVALRRLQYAPVSTNSHTFGSWEILTRKRRAGIAPRITGIMDIFMPERKTVENASLSSLVPPLRVLKS